MMIVLSSGSMLPLSEVRIMNIEDYDVNMSDHEYFRRKAVRTLGNKCVVCGCREYILLEIDHKFGVENRQVDRGVTFFKSIISGRKDVQLLCVRCHVLKHD